MTPQFRKKYQDRIMKNIETIPWSGCWIWLKGMRSNGYGVISYDKKPEYVHRVAFEVFKHAIPIGLQIDHSCNVRNCVNPDHLITVTPKENIAMRGTRPKQPKYYRNGRLYD